MRYFKITCSNGFCGCDEEFYVPALNEDIADEMGIDLLCESYSFAEPDDRFLDYDADDEESFNEALDWYYENMLSYNVEEISHKEFIENTGGWKI